jgi:hypothetical protein
MVEGTTAREIPNKIDRKSIFLTTQQKNNHFFAFAVPKIWISARLIVPLPPKFTIITCFR